MGESQYRVNAMVRMYQDTMNLENLSKPDLLRELAREIEEFDLDEDVAYDGDRPHYPTSSGLRKILAHITEVELSDLRGIASEDENEAVDGLTDTY